MLLIACIIVAVLVVATIVAVALLGWVDQISLGQRLGLTLIAAGIVWAGPSRALGQPAGAGDLVLLVGLLAFLWSIYGQGLWRHADGLDGRVDGRLGRPR